MDSSELISRCKAGDRQALHLLYQQYRPRLLRICRQYARDDDVAEDLLHDAFVIILTSLDKLRSDDKLEKWMTAIVKNVGVHYWKHIDQEQEAVRQMAGEDLVIEEPTPKPDFDELQALVALLPKGYQQVFRLSVFEGLSHQEISRKLGIAPHSSSSQLFHAKRMLRQLIKQSWILILLLIAIPTAWILVHKTEPTEKPVIATSEPHTPQIEPVIEPPHEEPVIPLPAQLTDRPKTSRLQTSDENTELQTSDETTMSEPQTKPSPSSRQSDRLESDSPQSDKKTDSLNPNTHPSITIRPSSVSRRSWNIRLAYNGQLGRHDDYLAEAAIGKSSFDALSNSMLSEEQMFSNWIDYNQYLNTSPWISYDAETRSIMNIAALNEAINGGVMEARYEHQLPVTVQLLFSRKFSSRLFVESGLSYTRLSSTVTTGSALAFIREHQRLSYLGVPFYWGWQWYDKGRLSIYTSAGAMIEVPICSSLDVNHMVNGSNTFSKTSVPGAPVQWSATLSLGIQHSLTSGFSIYMEPSLQYFFPDGSSLRTYRTEHPVSITLPFGIRYTW